MSDPRDHALAQLRHLYSQMIGGFVRDCESAAIGLLGPAIERLEMADPRDHLIEALNISAMSLEREVAERDQRIAELETELRKERECTRLVSERLKSARIEGDELTAQVAVLREALGKISEIRYGLDDTATDAESLDYWANLAIEYRTIAFAALAATEKKP